MRASSWSWVTYTNVIPTSRWMLFSSTCSCLRSFRSSAPERLVEQQHRGPVHERAGERHALLLPARELPRLALGLAREAHALELLGHAPANLVLRDPLALEPERHVALHAQVREQRVALEDGVGRPLEGGQARSRRRRRAAPRPPWAPRTRRSSAGSWSCRSPEGPSMVKNSPRSMSRSIASTAVKSPKRLVTALKRGRSGRTLTVHGDAHGIGRSRTALQVAYGSKTWHLRLDEWSNCEVAIVSHGLPLCRAICADTVVRSV